MSTLGAQLDNIDRFYSKYGVLSLILEDEPDILQEPVYDDTDDDEDEDEE